MRGPNVGRGWANPPSASGGEAWPEADSVQAVVKELLEPPHDDLSSERLCLPFDNCIVAGSFHQPLLTCEKEDF